MISLVGWSWRWVGTGGTPSDLFKAKAGVERGREGWRIPAGRGGGWSRPARENRNARELGTLLRQARSKPESASRFQCLDPATIVPARTQMLIQSRHCRPNRKSQAFPANHCGVAQASIHLWNFDKAGILTRM